MDLGHDHSSKWRGESRKASKPLRSNMNPNALLGSVQTFELRYDIPLVWEPDVGAAARLVERWAQRFAREAVKDSYRISEGAKKAASLDFF